MTTTHDGLCPRCRTKPSSDRTHWSINHFCYDCALEWGRSKESVRLLKIGPSLVAEWMGRERMEKLNATETKAGP